MGIDNINRAKCDKCGKEKFSTLKQSAFLNKLKEQGWSGNINKIYCDSCSTTNKKGKTHNEEKEYFGSAVAINKIGESYYVKVVNPAVSVYIPYSEFSVLNSNSLPSIDYIKLRCKNNNQDPNRLKYKASKKEKIADTEIYVAHLCDRINKGEIGDED